MSDPVVIDGAAARRVALAALVDVAGDETAGIARIHAADRLLRFEADERRVDSGVVLPELDEA